MFAAILVAASARGVVFYALIEPGGIRTGVRRCLCAAILLRLKERREPSAWFVAAACSGPAECAPWRCLVAVCPQSACSACFHRQRALL